MFYHIIQDWRAFEHDGQRLTLLQEGDSKQSAKPMSCSLSSLRGGDHAGDDVGFSVLGFQGLGI